MTGRKTVVGDRECHQNKYGGKRPNCSYERIRMVRLKIGKAKYFGSNNGKYFVYSKKVL